MRWWRSRARALAHVGLVVAVASGAVAFAHASTDGGYSMNGQNGCGADGGTCHVDSTGDSIVIVQLDGRPTTFEAGRTYDMVLRAIVPPGTTRPNTLLQGGFAMDSVPDGFFEVTDAKLQRTVAETLTHTREGGYDINWTIRWTAPRSLDQAVTLWGTAMVDGGQVQTATEDYWNTESWIIQPQKAGGGPLNASNSWIAFLLLLVLAVLAWVVIRRGTKKK